LWEGTTWRPLQTLQGHTGTVLGVALSGDGEIVVSGGSDGTVRLWETGSGRPLAALQGHTAGVRAVALSADGRLAASGGWDGTRTTRSEPTRRARWLSGQLAAGWWKSPARRMR